jgi:integrase
MRGSTRKRGSTWTAYWDVTDLATGERQQRTKGGFRTQKAAQAHLATVIVATNEGGYIEPSKQPFGAFLEREWLPAIRGELRPLTYENYRRIVATHIQKDPIGETPLRSLTAAHLNALYQRLEERGLAVGTRRLIHATLRRALNNAMAWDKIKTNPAGKANPPRHAAGRAQAWSTREVREFLEYVRGDRLEALWRLAVATGMRRGELLGLRWQDLDGDRVHVRQQALPTPGAVSFGPPKSRRSERSIALDAATVEALRHHRGTQTLERDLAGPAYQDHDLIFCNELGQPIRPTKLGDRFVQLRKAAGLPMGSLHTLRHTHITIALTEGIPVHVVAARAGDRPEQILSTYAHLLPHSDAEAAAAVAAAIDVSLTSR